MSDKKSLTPIIVGSVIALLGILTGLYIAANAREQLQAAEQEMQMTDNSTEKTAVSEQPAETASLPDLPAVDDMPLLVPDEPVVSDEPAEAEAVEETMVTEPSGETEADTDLGEPDDFVPVSPEEIEQSVPQQRTPQQDSL